MRPSDNPDEFDDATKDVKTICHSFVTDGIFSFLNDCTHELAGISTPMIPWGSLKEPNV